MNKYWRGRLKEEMKEHVRKFIGSIAEDERIAEIDIEVNEAHCLMLCKQKIISVGDCKKILFYLQKAKEDWQKGKFKIPSDSIDIHPIIEKYIIDGCGLDIGGKIHTAKSRNDQVTTDVRIYVRNRILELCKKLLDFIDVFLKVAGKNVSTIMPGYTHSHPAQITTVAHYLLSYVDKFFVDFERLLQVFSRVNMSPLGACALVGSTFNIDRLYTSKLLGFDGIVENSIDAVSNRDFALEILSQLSIISTGVSRVAEDLIEWSTFEDNFVKLPEDYCDISSAMPQKRNPDVLEMIRAKATRVVNLYSNLANILVGLRTGYNKDLQETKLYLWEGLDIVNNSISFLKDIVENLQFNTDKLSKVVELSYITAPDLTEYLVKSKKLSFRESYLIVGGLVNIVEKKKKKFSDLTNNEIKKVAKETIGKEFSLTKKEIEKITNPENSIRNRANTDGPNPDMVRKVIVKKRTKLQQCKKELEQIRTKLSNAKIFFEKEKQELLS